MRLVNLRKSCQRCSAVGAALVLAAALLSSTRTARAYVPTMDDLWARLAAGAPELRSAIVDTETLVYDPAAPGGGAAAEAPKPLAGRTFRQRMYWQRGGLLAVETTDVDGTLLHLSLRDGYRIYSRALSPTRVFAETDLRPLLYPFLEASRSAWHGELVFWGIQPLRIDVVPYGTATAWLLGEGAGRALWIDRIADRPVKLEATAGGSAPLGVTVQFSDFMPVAPKGADEANPRLPKVLTYEVDGHLFRRTTVKEVRADPSPRGFPIARWRQQLGLDTAPLPYSLSPAGTGRP